MIQTHLSQLVVPGKKEPRVSRDGRNGRHCVKQDRRNELPVVVRPGLAFDFIARDSQLNCHSL